LLGFGEDHDDEEDFTSVVSRRSGQTKKSACQISLGRTLSKSGVASAKALNDPPLCGIVARSRRRKQNPKYL
jgi:hypothetical protein